MKAARRHCSDPLGSARPEQAIITPRAPAPFPLTPASSLPLQRPPLLSPRNQATPPSSSSSTIAIANASLPSLLLHHYNTSTRAPVTHRLGPRSLIALGKQQRRVLARRSIPAVPVTVARETIAGAA